MQLIVLGMHRSGTSVLARLLNLMGVYFGPEGVSTGANQENPKGFWERRDVRALNDSVLHAVGCDWNRVLKLDVTALPQPVLADFDKRASRLVLEMDAHRPWLLKEPRLCLLLPLWRKWFEVPVCIHIYRNPVEVASSLHKRNGIPIEAGIALWERYVRSALDASVGLPRAVVSHRQLVREPAVAIAKLLEWLNGEGVPGLRLPTEREIAAFVEEDLYRERESREDLRAYAKVPQLRLFKTLETGRLLSGKATRDEAGLAALAGYEAGLPPIKPPSSEVKVPDITEVTLRGQLALREQEIQFVRQMSGKYEVDVRQRDERLAGMEREMLQARDRALVLEADVRQRDERLAGMEREALIARQMTLVLEGDLRQRSERLISIERDATTLREANTRLEAELRGRDDRLVGMERDGQALREMFAKREADLRDRDAKLTSMEQQVSTLRESIERRDERLAEAGSEAAVARDLIASLEQEAGLVRETLTEIEADLGRRNERIAQMEQEQQSKQGMIADLCEEKTVLQSLLQARIKQQERLEEDLLRQSQESKLAADARRKAEQDTETRYRELAKLTELLIERERELVSLNEANNQLEAQCRALAQSTDELGNQLAGLRNSRSWRLMAPMRAIGRMLRPGGAAQPMIVSQDMELLRKSTLFDRNWYLSTYPDVSGGGSDPVEHYLRYGADENRNPGPDFDTEKYLRANPDVAQSGVNPLVHYLAYGMAEGRRRE
jgi:hypothetical protein